MSSSCALRSFETEASMVPCVASLMSRMFLVIC